MGTQTLDHGVAGLGHIDDGRLDLGHDVDAVGDALGSDTRVLDSLEGKVVRTAGGRSVDLNGAALHGVADQHGSVDVLGEDAALQTKTVGIALLNGIPDVLDPAQGDDGPEGLLPAEPHVLGDVVHEDRVDEVALALPLLAECCALLLGVHGQSLNEVCGGLADDGCDGTVVLGHADRQLCHGGADLLLEGISNALNCQDNLHSRAALSTVGEAALDDVGSGKVQISILADNAGILASQLHLQGHHPSLLGNGDAGVAAGEADAVHAGVCGEVVADLRAAAGDHADEAGGDTGLVEALDHVDPAHAALGRRLEDNGVSGHEGGSQLGDGQVHGVVEWGDAEDGAEGDLGMMGREEHKR